MDGHDVELWQLDRKVAWFQHKQKSSPIELLLTRRINGRWSRPILKLERRLAKARRMAAEPTDPLTKERLAQLVRDLEYQLQ